MCSLATVTYLLSTSLCLTVYLPSLPAFDLQSSGPLTANSLLVALYQPGRFTACQLPACSPPEPTQCLPSADLLPGCSPLVPTSPPTPTIYLLPTFCHVHEKTHGPTKIRLRIFDRCGKSWPPDLFTKHLEGCLILDFRILGPRHRETLG